MGEFAVYIEHSEAKKCFIFRGAKGLCPWTPLGAPPPDPRYRLALRALAMAPLCQILNTPLCPSVCPSVTRVDQSKTVQTTIIKSSSSAAWKTLVSGIVKLFHEFEVVTPNKSAK